MKLYNVNFKPIGKKGECRDGESLLDCAHRFGVGIISLCGGLGKFNCCKVQILKGSVSKPTSNEFKSFSSQELSDGYRLACQTYINSDCNVRIPFESLTTSQRIQVEGPEVSTDIESSISSYNIRASSPSLLDLQADDKRIIETLNQQHKLNCKSIDIGVMQNLSSLLRFWNWEAQVSLRNNEVIAINAWHSRQLGLAIDLGTTTIAGYLLDILTGETLATQGIINPQISFGEDIVSRITYAMKSPAKAIELQQTVVKAFNQLVTDLCNKTNTKSKEILETVIVGNTVMHHLLLHLPVEQLAVSPFTATAGRALDIKARDIGLCIAPGAYVHLLPNIAGFVGADHVAMLLATEEIWKDENLVIALDIGTNTEISLIDNGEISSLSCASGPAFEGAHIKNGMRATNGAIERVQLINNQVKYETIGGVPPIGLCGSGILDAVSQLRLAGVINRDGRMNEHQGVRVHGKQHEFVLISKEEHDNSQAITITQKDVREIQLAKGAIRSGINVLLQKRGCSEKKLNKVIISGAFGSYINVMSALSIGMLPLIPLDNFQQVGNAAGIGAKIALLSNNKRAEAQAIALRASYIELAATPNFEKIFLEATYLG